MPVAVKGTGGGSVTLSAGAAATDTILTLPNTTGTVALTGSQSFSNATFTGTTNFPGSGVWDSSGNVGIGTTSPGAKLDVQGSGNITIKNSTTSTTTGYSGYSWATGTANSSALALLADNSGSPTWQLTAGSAVVAAYYDMPVHIWRNVAGTERMRLDSASGNVGIGTNSPSSKLSVGGNTPSTGTLSVVGSSSGIAAGFSDNVNSSIYFRPAAGGTVIGTDGGGNLRFATNGNATSNEVMRIDASGNLLVGTSSQPTNYGARQTLWADLTTQWGQSINSTSTTGTQFMVAFIRGNSGSAAGTITSTATNSVTYATSSDYRLKQDIQPMTSGLATVSALKPVTYKWKEDGTYGEGFIAHELQEVVPLSVVGEKNAVNADGSMNVQGVDYSKIVVHLVSAIKELSAKNDALEARLAKLETV